MSALPNYVSKEKFGANAELRNVLQEKWIGRGGSNCRFDRLQKIIWGGMQHRCVTFVLLQLSHSYISPNQACLPHMFRFKLAPQNPDVLRSTLHIFGANSSMGQIAQIHNT